MKTEITMVQKRGQKDKQCSTNHCTKNSRLSMCQQFAYIYIGISLLEYDDDVVKAIYNSEMYFIIAIN
jgi:hypothetical protein